MTNIIQDAVEDIRVTFLIIFILLIFGSLYSILSEIAPNEQTKTMIKDSHDSGVKTIYLIWGAFGIIGTIGSIVTVVSFFKDNFGGL